MDLMEDVKDILMHMVLLELDDMLELEIFFGFLDELDHF